MKIVPPEPQVKLYEEGFEENDILERKKVGAALSDLVNRIDDPMVIALDGKWGTGKSYFLKRWVHAHNVENGGSATTVYFDAFAHDYLSDPLPALVSELVKRLPEGSGTQIDNLKSAAFKVMKPVARLGLAALTQGATEVLGNFGDAVVEAAGKEASAGIDRYWAEQKSRHDAIEEFQNAIKALARPAGVEDTSVSVIIVIDELDRCRPDYALAVLEIIKHFFTAPHVYFVLGVNLEALENSVHARYGDKVDAQEYLKKFIQVTLELPVDLGTEHHSSPAILVYLDHLINEMGIPQHIARPLEKQLKMVACANNVSLRDVGKIVSSVALAASSVREKDNWLNGWIGVMNDLIIAKIIRPDLYPKFLNASISDKELQSFFGATKSVLYRDIDGEPNPDYNNDVFWRYHTWRYLVQNGHLANEDDCLAEAIGGQFDRFGFCREARKVPMKIKADWLDQFQFFRP